MDNHMSNNKIKKRAADLHNKKRREEHVDRVRLEQDKIDNPEKYARRNRRAMRKVMPFIALSAAAGIPII
jgi:hypothetical protein